MRFRSHSLIGLVVLLGIITFGIAAFKTYGNRNAQPANNLQQVTTNVIQLQAANGVIPVEIEQPGVHYTAANGVQDFFFTIKNNTSKTITAYSFNVTLKGEVNGKDLSNTLSYTVDTITHQDIRDAHSLKPISPGEERNFSDNGLPNDPTQTGSNIVKEITFKLDYVEFEDKTGLGPDQNGSRTIALRRDGAAKYKAWLVEKYTQSGKSISGILPLLQSHDLPPELNLQDTYQRIGAKSYRAHMLDVYNSHQAGELEKYLNR